jgi:hypothetical protein
MTFAVVGALTILVVGAQAAAATPQKQASVHGSPPGAPPPFVTPPGGSKAASPNAFGGVDTTLRRADGSLFERESTDAAGRVLSQEYYAQDGSGSRLTGSYASGGSASGTRMLARAAPRRLQASCGNDARNPSAQKWNSTMNWYWNQGSTPGYLNLDNTLTSLRGARIAWESNQNWCGIADASTMNFTYQGTTTLSYGQNGVSTVGFGDVGNTGCGAGVLACTLRIWNGSNVITEADTRLSTAVTWHNGGQSGTFDVQSVQTHESGHAIGFDHVNDSTNVMYPYINSNDTSDRLLGRGDANENNAKY